MFLVVFCYVDDLYRERVPETIQRRSQHERIEMSDAEESFLRFVRKNYLHLFPRLRSRDRYNRRR